MGDNNIFRIGAFVIVFILSAFIVAELPNFAVLENISETGINLLRICFIAMPILMLGFMWGDR